MIRKTGFVGTISLASVLVLVGCGRPFDAARWKAERNTADCTRMSRSAMVDDLRAQLSRGMTMREIRRFLGKPNDVGADLKGRGVWWSYVTGQDGVDCSTLDLRFKNGRLQETAIGQT
jgi:hypothetical protein